VSENPPILVIVLDGLGDRPWPVLGGKTPLQAATTPNLDALAAHSATGVLHPLGPGRAPGTEFAHFVLFGYPPEFYPGRAVFEAAGHGIELREGQVALHAIFSTVRREPDGTLTIVERYPQIAEEHAAGLAKHLTSFEHGELILRLHHTVGTQAILVIDGPASPDVTDTDPHNNGWPAGTVQPLDDAADPAAARATAEALAAYLRHAYKALRTDIDTADPESTFLLLKWVGRKRPLPSFESRTGMNGTVVSSAALFEGLCAELGIEHVRVPVDREDLTADMAVRYSEGTRLLGEGRDFVLVHNKAPDEAGHTKDPLRKRDAIEAIDRGLAGLVERAGLPEPAIIVVTADHGTPSGTTLIHSGDPVPIAICADAVQPDGVTEFDPLACSAGSLGQLNGEDLMPVLLNARGTVRYTGGRLTTHTGLHWPRDYEPFRVG
jgi:2,3-bisphosphoglycerate-independent phosphoglycerate mutase